MGGLVFISYSRRDAISVHRLAEYLKETGIAVWMDASELRGAVRWRDEIAEAIRAAVLFVVADSSAWQQSVECGKEAAEAEKHNKIVVRVAADSPVTAREVITRQLRQIDLERPWEYRRAELCARSDRWASRRNPGQLASKRAVREYRKIPAGVLDDESVGFLTASRRRQRRTRALRVIGVLVTVLCLLGFGLARGVADAAKKQISQLFDKADRNDLLASLPGTLAYAQLESLTRTNEPTTSRDLLALALSVPLPDRSSTLARTPRAIAAVNRSTVTVVDSDGRLGSATTLGVKMPAAGFVNTVAAGAISPNAAHVLLAGSRKAALVSKTRRRSIPCGGTLAAVADDASGVIAHGNTACRFVAQGTAPARLHLTSAITAVAAWRGGAVVGRVDGQIDILTGTGVHSVAPPVGAGPVVSVSAIRNGSRLAVAYTNTGSAAIISTATAALIARTSALSYVGPSAWSPDGAVLAIAEGTTVGLVDPVRGAKFSELDGGSGRIQALSFDLDGSGIWAMAAGGRLSHWQWRTGSRIDHNPVSYVTGAVAWQGGIAYLERDGDVHTVDLNGRHDSVLMRAFGPAATLRTDASGQRLLAVESRHSSVLTWDASVSRSKRVNVGCEPYDAEWSADGTKLYVTCLGEHKITLVDVASGTISHNDRPEVPYVATLAVRADASLVLYGNLGGVWAADAHLHTITRLGSTYCPAAPNAVVLNRSIGAVFAVTGGGALGCISRTNSDGAVEPWVEPRVASPLAQAIAVDERRGLIGFGFADGMVLLTDLNGRPVQVVEQMPGPVRALGFLPRNRLWMVGETGVIVLTEVCPWHGAPNGAIEEAKRRIQLAISLGLTK